MLLWLFVVLPAVLGQAGFGRSYLKNSRLCHQWNCINTNLRFPETLPLQYDTKEALQRVLPVGSWQEVVDTVLDKCYVNRTRRYTNTCPGQALLHCVVDQMIDNCPEEYLRKDDACSPVTSLAGLKNMFAQSRYDNLEKNLPKERRPSWFLKNYFNSKCCELPEMFNKTLLQECGFSSFITYHTHGPKYTDVHLESQTSVPVTTTLANNGDTLKIVDFNQMPLKNDTDTDPLDCCNMTEFIQPSWRSECDFQLNWGGQDRLVISSKQSVSTEAPVTTTTEGSPIVMDSMLVPQTCEKETCVFRNLGIINAESGAVDIDAYIKMLHNFTEDSPEWAKGKARVVTNCLTKPLSRSYDSGCEINDLLSCTFDVLTEKCPHSMNSTISHNCKHDKNQAGCQISSSKYRPKNRRELCILPQIVNQDILSKCGLDSLYRIEKVAVPVKPRTIGWSASRYVCKDSTDATTCIMNKMSILNKYKFMDYFKMKDRIRHFTADQVEWAALLDIYMNAFTNIPMYSDHCNSQKKLLNVVDAMLMTCPISKRKNTAQCNKIFTEMTNTDPIDNQKVTRVKLDEILQHYYHVFMPTHLVTPKVSRVIRKKHSKLIKKPLFEFGLLNSKNAPPVQVIDVKPAPAPKRPLILQPVYLRPSFIRPYNNDGVFRSMNKPFSLHVHLARPHTSTPMPIVHTVPTLYNNVYSTRPIFTSTAPTYAETVTPSDMQ